MISTLSEPTKPHRFWLFCICAGMLLFFTQVTMLFPVLPLYVTQQWGEKAPVGLVVGAMAMGLLFFRPGIGLLIDRWGRKPVLWMGLLIMLGILPLYAWAPNPFWLMGIRVFHGISQAAFATTSQTLLADLVPAERRTAMMGYLAMSNTIGFSLGPLLGSVLFGVVGFSGVVLTMLGITLLGLVISLPLPWVVSQGRSLQTTLEPLTGFPWNYILKFPVRDATFFFFIGSFLHGGVVTFLPLLMDNSALFYSLNAFIAVFVRFGLGRWERILPQPWLVSGALFCEGTALLGLSLLPQYLVFWSILYGVGFGTLFPVLSAIVSLSAPVEVRGRVYSFFLAGFDGGMMLGGAGLQPLTHWFSLRSLFTLLGGLGSGLSIVAFRQFAKSASRQSSQ
ncbi:MAG: MFS transporter [Oculatellaceae cyanobacterium bins.114]|nr:MFS transporter [Oculatellaceae cyanobacterium bins.114]